MSNLLLISLPAMCRITKIRKWVESRGIGTQSERIVRDLVSGTTPSFGHVELKNNSVLKWAISTLNGKTMRGHTVRAKADPAYA